MRLWNDSRLQLNLTRLGLEVIVLLLLLGLFAVTSGSNALTLIFGLLMGLFLMSGVLSMRALKGLALQGLETGHLFARVRGGIRMRLSDRHPRRARGLEVHLTSPNAQTEPAFYGGASHRPDGVVVSVQPERRGFCRLDHLELRTRFPFGFMEKVARIPLERDVLVCPHPRHAGEAVGDMGEGETVIRPEGDSQPDGSRPFRIGDALRRLHWKRTAQHQSPWVRTFEAEDPTGVHLELDLTAWNPGEAFELHLESLSGIILQARIRRHPVTLELMDPEGTRQFHGHESAWRALALCQPAPSPHRSSIPPAQGEHA